MSVVVGQVVKNAAGEIGRVCRLNSLEQTACVQFASGCRKVAQNALQPAQGTPPPCSAQCMQGC
jgi:hypothetical protein